MGFFFLFKDVLLLQKERSVKGFLFWKNVQTWPSISELVSLPLGPGDTAPESGDRPGSPVCSVQGKSGGRDDPEVLAGPRQGHQWEAPSATPVSPGGPRNPPSAHLSGQQRDEDGCQGCRPAPRRQQLCCPSASRSGRGSGPHSETGRHRLLPERSWNLKQSTS